jgi:hypothetical protein
MGLPGLVAKPGRNPVSFWLGEYLHELTVLDAGRKRVTRSSTKAHANPQPADATALTTTELKHKPSANLKPPQVSKSQPKPKAQSKPKSKAKPESNPIPEEPKPKLKLKLKTSFVSAELEPEPEPKSCSDQLETDQEGSELDQEELFDEDDLGKEIGNKGGERTSKCAFLVKTIVPGLTDTSC